MNNLFKGTLNFVRITYTIEDQGLKAIAISPSDMTTIVNYAKLCAVPISKYASQYGDNSIDVADDIIQYGVLLPTAQFTEANLKGWVEDIVSQHQLPASSCVVVLKHDSITNTSWGAGTGGEHYKGTNPYILSTVAGIFDANGNLHKAKDSIGLTVHDELWTFAGNLSHEIAEMVVDPQGGNPEVCDPCGPQNVSTYLNYFDFEGNYIKTSQTPPYTVVSEKQFEFNFYINGIVKPAYSAGRPAPAEGCSYAPPAPNQFPSALEKEPVFDADFYLSHYPDLRIAFGSNAASALNHWITQGLPNEGRRGSMEFDVQYYLQHNPDIRIAFGTNFSAAANHWITQGLPVEGRRGSREVDIQFYLRHYPDLLRAFGNNYTAVMNHWITRGLPFEARRSSREFDVQFYLQNNPDLVAAFGTNYNTVGFHWVNQGFPNEGRKGCLEFDIKFYINNYPDLVKAFGNNYNLAIDHWITTGLPNEGRKGSGNFDVQFYLGLYPDLQAAFGKNFTAVFDHWINYGKAEGRKGTP